MGVGSPFGVMKCLEVHRGDGCTTLLIYEMLPNTLHLKWVMVNFVMLV